MRHKKRRGAHEKPTAWPDKIKLWTAEILKGIISGLITAAILKLLDW